jgi:hypothetical protein
MQEILPEWAQNMPTKSRWLSIEADSLGRLILSRHSSSSTNPLCIDSIVALCPGGPGIRFWNNCRLSVWSDVGTFYISDNGLFKIRVV